MESNGEAQLKVHRGISRLMMRYGNVFFQKPIHFLKDSHFTNDDISVDINTATQMFLEGKAAMFHGYPALMQEYQEQMDAELTRIPFFSQISDEAFINMTPSLNIAFNKDLEKELYIEILIY